jgi:hypothetical protein
LSQNLDGDLQNLNRWYNSGLNTIDGVDFYKNYSKSTSSGNILEVAFEDNGNITLKYEVFESSTHTQIIGTWDSTGITMSGDFVINASSENVSNIQSNEYDGRITLLQFGHGTGTVATTTTTTLAPDTNVGTMNADGSNFQGVLPYTNLQTGGVTNLAQTEYNVTSITLTVSNGGQTSYTESGPLLPTFSGQANPKKIWRERYSDGTNTMYLSQDSSTGVITIMTNS